MRIFLLLFIFLNSVLLRSQVLVQSTVVSGLHYPVAFAITPDQRYLVTLKGHDATTTNCDSSFIKIFDAQGNFMGNFFRLDGDSNFCYGETGILGICLDADYANNNFVYFYYNHDYAGYSAIRVVRLTDQGNVGVNPTIILDIPASFASQIHVGGNLRTSLLHAGNIFVSIGDLGNQSNAQDLSVPFGKILRVNTDGTIPLTNPFYDDGLPAAGNDDRIYSYGHRNPFDFCISRLNGKIYCSENGWNAWDEVNLIGPGNNYGWPVCEGFYEWNSTTILCDSLGLVDPLEDWGAPLPALTGIEFYTDSLMPSLTNHLLVADNNFGNLYDCNMGNGPDFDTVLQRTTLADLTSSGGLTTVLQGPDGCIYAMKGGFTSSGAIYRLCPSGIGVNENNFNSASIRIFPVPANDSFSISAAEKIFVQLFDAMGKKLWESREFNSCTFVLSGELNSGVYFIRAENLAGNVFFSKVIVQH